MKYNNLQKAVSETKKYQITKEQRITYKHIKWEIKNRTGKQERRAIKRSMDGLPIDFLMEK